METNINQFQAFRQSDDLNRRLQSFQSQETRGAAKIDQRDLEINLTTKEGDKVSISIEAKSALLQAQQERYLTDETGSSYQKNELTMALYEREVTFSVEGDLNQDERRDIETALKTLDRMLNHFSNGLVKPMLAESKRLENLDTIAGLEAQMSYEKTTITAEKFEAETIGKESLFNAAPQKNIAQELFEKADALAEEMAQNITTDRSTIKQLKPFADQLFTDYRKQFEQSTSRGVDIMDYLSNRFYDMIS